LVIEKCIGYQHRFKKRNEQISLHIFTSSLPEIAPNCIDAHGVPGMTKTASFLESALEMVNRSSALWEKAKGKAHFSNAPSRRKDYIAPICSVTLTTMLPKSINGFQMKDNTAGFAYPLCGETSTLRRLGHSHLFPLFISNPAGRKRGRP
jgi:hypothetical protein